MSETGLSLRERNKQRTRTEIADGALRLFAARGFDAVTVEDILTAVGVSRRTFFRYFGSKEEALLSDYPLLNDRLDRALTAAPDQPVLAQVRLALLDLARYYVADKKAVLTRSRVIRDASGPGLASRNLELIGQWESRIAVEVARGLGGSPADLRPRLVAGTIVAAFRAALAQWVRRRTEADLLALVGEVMDILEGGLAPVFDT